MATRLNDDEIHEAMETLHWTRENKTIVKTVKLRDFADALKYVNRIGALAEARNHHPDICISWNTVTLTLTTHSEGGLTDADMDMAAVIDAEPL